MFPLMKLFMQAVAPCPRIVPRFRHCCRVQLTGHSSAACVARDPAGRVLTVFAIVCVVAVAIINMTFFGKDDHNDHVAVTQEAEPAHLRGFTPHSNADRTARSTPLPLCCVW